MNAPERRRRAGGFTLLEVVISTATIAVLILAGTVASRSSVNATTASLDRSERIQETARLLERYQDVVGAAGLSTLQAVPPGGQVPEPMQDGLSYDNVTYRQVAGVQGADLVYEPAPGTEPMALWFEPGQGPTGGALMTFDGRSKRVLQRDLLGVTFTRSGSVLTIEMKVMDDAHPKEGSAVTRTLVLRNP